MCHLWPQVSKHLPENGNHSGDSLGPRRSVARASYIRLDSEVGKMWGSSDTAYETKMSSCLNTMD